MYVSKFLKGQAKGFFASFPAVWLLKADPGKTMTPCGTGEQANPYSHTVFLAEALPINRLHSPEMFWIIDELSFQLPGFFLRSLT